MKGGARPNAGRKKGTKNKETTLRKKIINFFTEQDIKDLVEEAKKQAYEKPELLKFLLEQIFGRAFQSIELGGKDGESINIQISREIAEKNKLNDSNKSTR